MMERFANLVNSYNYFRELKLFFPNISNISLVKSRLQEGISKFTAPGPLGPYFSYTVYPSGVKFWPVLKNSW